ncbi:uncharacterized protein FIBRA_02669 [Fibroporia radiculosa]|uniref:intramembrane prenyl-peptidase Rce1 n=1 Tax=Fibroporia radiculosa TaxID=599839 RepID=J4HVA6_9APHY|nr:uncharacterized protein FIBRA_02669 [Fibroporia radiculosa]CCM00632.1 predicted protein [Fibroporia radiculosa]
MPLAFASPPISLNTAHALALSFVGSYVGSLYISKNARLSFKKVVAPDLREGEQRAKEDDERWRNDPDVIRARVTAAGLSTVSSCVVVLGVVWAFVGWDMKELPIALETTLTRLGFDTDLSLSQIVLPSLVTPVLYAGPLYAYFLAGRLPFQRSWSWRRCIAPIVTTWQGWRDFIVGPTTEEVVFRACTLAVYQLAGASVYMKIFLPPLLFGLAHVHHAWDKFNRFGRTKAAAQRAILETIFQLIYHSTTYISHLLQYNGFATARPSSSNIPGASYRDQAGVFTWTPWLLVHNA